MDALGTMHESIYKADQSETTVKTVYLYNAHITLEDNREIVLPCAHLNYYNRKSKKHAIKQTVLTQVTLWDKSTLPANSQFVIKAINNIPFRLWASTNEKSQMTARDQEPVIQNTISEESVSSPPHTSTEVIVTPTPAVMKYPKRCCIM